MTYQDIAQRLSRLQGQMDMLKVMKQFIPFWHTRSLRLLEVDIIGQIQWLKKGVRSDGDGEGSSIS